jgi:hypothetical protein
MILFLDYSVAFIEITVIPNVALVTPIEQEILGEIFSSRISALDRHTVWRV